MRAAGMMSGTSLDGVDIAVLDTDGVDIAGFGPTAYQPYAQNARAVLRAALGTWPGDPRAEIAARVVEDAHIALARGFLQDLAQERQAALAAAAAVAAQHAAVSAPPRVPAPVSLLGFHGQTLAHDPAVGRTHQAGDGARLAQALGLDTVWDFRSNDVAFGGQGAPLAPFYHWACARWAGLQAPVAFLNLGGVGNLTWVDPRTPAPETPGALLAFDTGPANAPMDDLCAARGLGAYDAEGALAASGQADAGVLADFLKHAHFARMPPKSLDRDAFGGLGAAVAHLPDADALATLAACVVASVAQGLHMLPAPVSGVYVSGGGAANRAVMAGLAQHLPVPVAPVEALGLSGALLEAQAFAYLAVRVARGLPTSAPGTTGVPAAVGGGEISRVAPRAIGAP